MTNALYYLWAGLLGAVFGSFINVVALRDKKRLSILVGRSECPHCKHILAWYDLVPIVSFLTLGGRCRYCKKPISQRYVVMEVLMASLGVLAAWLGFVQQGSVVMAAGLFLAFALFMVVSAIDLETMYIPVEYCVAAGVIGGVANLLAKTLSLQSVLLGALIGGGLIAAILYGWKLLFKQEGMGTGDIWVAAAVGAIVGYPLIFIAIMSAFMVGAVVGLVLMALRKKTMETAIPFGPFLFIGLLITLVWGQLLLSWYIL